jgi:hypothetical protein
VETIQNPKLLESYMVKRDIRGLFGGPVPRFFLLRYSPGELLTTPFSPSKYLQFVVEGELFLYEMTDEESIVTIQTDNNDVSILGDVELVDAEFTPFFVEAKSTVYTLAVYLDQYREQLLKDPVFLVHACRGLANKLGGAVACTRHGSLRYRVNMLVRKARVGEQLSSLGHMSRLLNVSTRQLLRVLKELCDQGVLEHRDRGVYIVLKKPELLYDDERRREEK